MANAEKKIEKIKRDTERLEKQRRTADKNLFLHLRSEQNFKDKLEEIQRKVEALTDNAIDAKDRDKILMIKRDIDLLQRSKASPLKSLSNIKRAIEQAQHILNVIDSKLSMLEIKLTQIGGLDVGSLQKEVAKEQTELERGFEKSETFAESFYEGLTVEEQKATKDDEAFLADIERRRQLRDEMKFDAAALEQEKVKQAETEDKQSAV